MNQEASPDPVDQSDNPYLQNPSDISKDIECTALLETRPSSFTLKKGKKKIALGSEPFGKELDKNSVSSLLNAQCSPISSKGNEKKSNFCIDSSCRDQKITSIVEPLDLPTEKAPTPDAGSGTQSLTTSARSSDNMAEKKVTPKEPVSLSPEQIEQEIEERYSTESDILAYFENGKSDWKLHKHTTIDLSVNQFWTEFLAEDAAFGLDKLQEIQGFWDVVFQPLEDSKRIMTLVVPVTGVPFVSKTRVTKTVTFHERSENKIIFEIVSKTHEAPYSDTFVCKETWIIVGSVKDAKYPQVRLSQLYQVSFHKYTMFKGQITGRSEEGIILAMNKWLEYAKENGHLDKKSGSPSIIPEEKEKFSAVDGPKEAERNITEGALKTDDQEKLLSKEQAKDKFESAKEKTFANPAKKEVKFETKELPSGQTMLDQLMSIFRNITLVPALCLLLFVILLTVQTTISMNRNSKMDILIQSMQQTQASL